MEDFNWHKAIAVEDDVGGGVVAPANADHGHFKTSCNEEKTFIKYSPMENKNISKKKLGNKFSRKNCEENFFKENLEKSFSKKNCEENFFKKNLEKSFSKKNCEWNFSRENREWIFLRKNCEENFSRQN